MKLEQVKTLLNAVVLTGEQNLQSEMYSACGADLMSDVLAFSKERAVLLTGLINPQVIRTAEMMDVKAVVFVRGKTPTKEICDLAVEKDMTVMTTEYPMYIACGILYAGGLRRSEADEAAL